MLKGQNMNKKNCCGCPEGKEYIHCGCDCHKEKCEHETDEGGYCEECGTYKQMHKELFHVFTHNRDEWLTKKTPAIKLARQWAKEYGCARVYHETEWNTEDGIFEDGDCIYSKGEYPY
jgi:hypothetical protein